MPSRRQVLPACRHLRSQHAGIYGGILVENEANIDAGTSGAEDFYVRFRNIKKIQGRSEVETIWDGRQYCGE
ncbi:hypothetical protein Y032_0469g2026 [Ancylostoma ceylanicum]|uniref:Uncharacterized protein n=1 Tax=Ancylostoma ceylanicum TaxID=53326 RepID=A0A016WY49_9BILA|nr:hypothetical protein Y032_0469g2026 [Ancylostoma ceylanicum]